MSDKDSQFRENQLRENQRREVLRDANLDTLAIRAGYQRTAEGEHSEAMFLTSSYVFDNAEQAAARFAGSEPGNVYSRYTNPTVRAFEERLAAMEGAEMAVATASGMAAILSTCMALLKSGDHIVCSRSVFGTTTVVFNKFLAKFGVETTFVALTDYRRGRMRSNRIPNCCSWKRRRIRSTKSPILRR